MDPGFTSPPPTDTAPLSNPQHRDTTKEGTAANSFEIWMIHTKTGSFRLSKVNTFFGKKHAAVRQKTAVVLSLRDLGSKTNTTPEVWLGKKRHQKKGR